MSDSLGRSLETVKPPVCRAAWLLPQSAYRLLMDFLRCDRAFCNHVIPRFHDFGWVTLRPTRAKEPGEGERTGQEVGCLYSHPIAVLSKRVRLEHAAKTKPKGV